MANIKYSFDDLDIGITENYRILKERLISKPSGLSLQDWYVFAGKVCKLLNTIQNDKRDM